MDHSEDWNTAQYTFFISRLWGNGQAERKWRQTLPTKLTPIQAERHMVAKYDPNGTEMDNFVGGGWCKRERAQNESCLSYVISLKDTKEMVNAWTQEVAISAKALILAVRTGVRNIHMSELLLEEAEKSRQNGKPRTDPTWERIEELAEYADKKNGIRDGTPKRRNRLGQFQRQQTSTCRTLSYQDPNRKNTEEREEDESRQAEEMANDANSGIEEQLCRVLRPSEQVALWQVRQIREFIQPRMTEFTIEDMQESGKIAMVLCRERFLPQHEAEVLGTICNWSSNTNKGCRLHEQGRCRFEHKERSPTICPEGEKGTCKKGGTCPMRHPGDVYTIYVPQKGAGGRLKQLTIYDRKNTFSQYHIQQ